ncbi:phage tail assembly chaperone [Serratia aquatilis]|uniref:Phage tail assembly chaperone n=1 Tax=Serratia aquatilis TaxID=1737515 RepID=A0ABV6EGE4_9GAMM
MAKIDLRALISAPMAGFRTKEVCVAEWGGAKVILREPSQQAWGLWRDIITPVPAEEGKEPAKLSISEETQRNLRADALLFTQVLLDEKFQPVFLQENIDQVIDFYGPVHARLLSQAIELQTSIEEAAKKPASQKPNS